MTDKKISELTDGGAIKHTDEMVVVRAGSNVKANMVRVGYEDLKPTGGHTPGGVAGPSTVNSFGIHELLEYPGGTNKRATYIYHLPHDFVEGTDMFIHVHHAPSAAVPAGQVDWKIHCQYAQGYGFGAYSATDMTETISIDLTGIAQYTHLIAEGLAINDASVGSVLRTDGIFVVTLERLASTDTSTGDQIFFEMDMHYQSDGTKTINKNDTGTGFQKV